MQPKRITEERPEGGWRICITHEGLEATCGTTSPRVGSLQRRPHAPNRTNGSARVRP